MTDIQYLINKMKQTFENLEDKFDVLEEKIEIIEKQKAVNLQQEINVKYINELHKFKITQNEFC